MNLGGSESAPDRFWFFVDDQQKHTRGPGRDPNALFPVTNCRQANPELEGKLLLSQAQLLPNRLHVDFIRNTIIPFPDADHTPPRMASSIDQPVDDPFTTAHVSLLTLHS